ncbi:MAG: type II toxin-antitoxin system VapC family toxin [Methanobacteriota archaeon]
MTVLIDSWAWIEYFRGSAAGRKVLPYVEGDDEAVVSALNVAEVYRWFLRELDEPSAHEALVAMTERSSVRDVTLDIAVEAARIRHRTGWGLGDSIVYATARADRAVVVTGDPDFRGAEGVVFVG